MMDRGTSLPMDVGPYEFERVMRRPFLVTALLVAGALFYIGVSIGAPLVILALWGTATFALLVAVVVNRRAGVTIRDGVMTVTAGSHRERILLSDIARVTASRWTDGPDEYVVETRSGKRLSLPQASIPPATALDEALSERGVIVESRRLKGTRT